ncbi:hypothetical protein EYC87_13455 [Halieaceae bacterium IMCC8485]|jgi:hypothetical protein|uniref:Uncharacterized protein n=1 Tax=Candidatus Seongchinamella marina TaxID=2518990 RepID=A0ABT3SXE4_9GAMM|nr:hypothetical protein [Candidatus Seongchinamella marina]MCX2974595.1 hypothetical protein [Candidatus Seongchinamella marina]
MAGTIGPLLASDEQFNHQVVETFASVGQSDPAWTEKVCGMAAAIDGSLQIGFGFGKYTNRNVIDAYAGVSRGAEQWVVRASRSLDSEPDSVNVGPIRYEVIEPLQQIKVTLEANEVQPIAFELFFHATVACVVEDREDRRDMHGFRKATDQIRYHQSGLASGWLEVDGERVEIARESWVATRDKSWGIRPMVGLPAADLEPDYHQHIPQALAIWNPIVFLDDVGASYAFHHYYLQFSGPGFSHQRIQGGFEGDSGQREKVIGMTPQLCFDSPSKRLQEGEFLLHMEDGSDRLLKFKKLSETGFYLGSGHYHGGDGHHHGSWRGPLHVDGDYVENAALPEVIERYHQFRDCMIQVEDTLTGATGYGNCQTYVHGAWPEFGLSGEEPMY